MCVVCARDCPTKALTSEQGEEELHLYFTPGLCHGCLDRESCQVICPEQAIDLRDDADPITDQDKILLVQSELLKCSFCGHCFAPLHKLQALARKGQTSHELLHDLCPLCRRTNLVVSFIQEKRVPGAKAKYRSTTDILRRSGHLKDRYGKKR